MEGTSHMNGFIRRALVCGARGGGRRDGVRLDGERRHSHRVGEATAGTKRCRSRSPASVTARIQAVPAAPSRARSADWTLSGGAEGVSGNEPWKVGGSGARQVAGPARGQRGDHRRWRAWASQEPTLRFFASATARGCSDLDAGRLGLRQDVARARRAGPGRRRARQRPVEADSADADRRQPAAAAPGRPDAGGVRVHAAARRLADRRRLRRSHAVQLGALSAPAASGCGCAPPASPRHWRSGAGSRSGPSRARCRTRTPRASGGSCPRGPAR